jgi:ParE toxin of type II toxin-antitoxin system, parDE
MLPVHMTSHCLRQLEGLQGQLTWPSPDSEYSHLLERLGTSVIPNLARFPEIGQPYLAQPPQSIEALELLSKLPLGAADRLRLYKHDVYQVIYSVRSEVVYLLSIRHHRQLSFDFAGLLPT